MEQIETWRDFPHYEGLYQVSNMGRIKAPQKIDAKGITRKERMIKGSINNEGYWRLRLWKDKKAISISIHRMVAIAFLLNSENKPRVNHKDNNPSNNRLDNLEWATHQEDIDHKCRQNRQNRPIGVKNPRFGLFGKDNPMYGRHYNVGGDCGRARLVLDIQMGIYYDCVKDAACAKALNAATLYNRLTGRRKNNTSLILVD